jgi:hypothetical protein
MLYVPPAGFEPALPPPETGKTPIMPVSGAFPFHFACSGCLEWLGRLVVHCTNPCTNDDLLRAAAGLLLAGPAALAFNLIW